MPPLTPDMDEKSKRAARMARFVTPKDTQGLRSRGASLLSLSELECALSEALKLSQESKTARLRVLREQARALKFNEVTLNVYTESLRDALTIGDNLLLRKVLKLVSDIDYFTSKNSELCEAFVLLHFDTSEGLNFWLNICLEDATRGCLIYRLWDSAKRGDTLAWEATLKSLHGCTWLLLGAINVFKSEVAKQHAEQSLAFRGSRPVQLWSDIV